ncbi:MAG TPA: YbaB/EbfC family nucleoid-associated protein [Candidatus Dojkabacteria bacterium]|nr:YbaB/EbfC family nucleoid-associated protein [Candidatus Dojkabacteria bacterium]HRO64893.1 YbaB/EbfC family nucleoid-associated protein [Candidatus Dojkabacteria bacterium]HRP36256.1 YbaB/EbfC family nucleoid-associated protein [Candidatus Dojkabacteria bacterium]HRP51567.1 YbaB/EbfC family nucleoid-associated protein [Candidatus Dojkabacteria bacterium]
MFGKAKDLYAMQKEARAMQKQMKQLRVEGRSEDELVIISMNGVQEIENIEIHNELMDLNEKNQLVKSLKQAWKDAQKNLQKEMMKDFDMDKLKGMLGG